MASLRATSDDLMTKSLSDRDGGNPGFVVDALAHSDYVETNTIV